MCILNNSYSSEFLLGKWAGTRNPDAKDVPLSTFTISFHKKDSIVKGHYCYITQYGSKIDCDPTGDDNIFNIKTSRNNEYSFSFKSFNNESLGTGKISVVNDEEIEWSVIDKPTGDEYFGPEKYMLHKKHK